jgi:hypothetical protein
MTEKNKLKVHANFILSTGKNASFFRFVVTVYDKIKKNAKFFIKNNSDDKFKIVKGKKKLEQMLNEMVLQNFPEISTTSIKINYGHTGNRNYASITFDRTANLILSARITIDDDCRDFSTLSIQALIAHELGHLIVGANEFQATSFAIERGYRSSFEALFAEVCRVPCTRIEEVDEKTIIHYNHKIIGELDCVEFCPYGIVNGH